jgi:hypothetical protein
LRWVHHAEQGDQLGCTKELKVLNWKHRACAH